MAIAFACECGKRYKLKDSLAGRRVKCVQCHKETRIPKPEPGEEEEVFVAEVEDDSEDFEVVAEAPAKKPQAAEAPAAQENAFADFEVVEEAAPAKKSPRASDAFDFDGGDEEEERPRRRGRIDYDDDDDERLVPRSRRRRDDDDDEDDRPASRRKKPAKKKRRGKKANEGGVNWGSVGGGVVSLIIGLVLLALIVNSDRVRVKGYILCGVFTLGGIAAIISGMMGIRDDDD